jgi:hypothetical protein
MSTVIISLGSCTNTFMLNTDKEQRENSAKHTIQARSFTRRMIQSVVLLRVFGSSFWKQVRDVARSVFGFWTMVMFSESPI